MLAAGPDWDLLQRHDLLANKVPVRFSDRLWRYFRAPLSAIGLLPPWVTRYSWVPTLKHAPVQGEVRPLLIWTIGLSRDELREACAGFSRRLREAKDVVPVLVTDTADFAYFSRLGWLVEYVPCLGGDGHSYADRKRRYLAWRYRDACVVPGAAGLANDVEWQALLRVDK